MENKFNKTNYKATGWDHFRARDLHRKKNMASNNVDESQNSKVNDKNNKVFSWIAETLNPLNHLPIVSSVKNLITKSEKSLDIIQSAVGGFFFAGPLGILKGIGSWAANKITNKIISSNSNGLISNKNLDINSESPKNNPNRKEKEKTDLISNNLYFRSLLQNNEIISNSKTLSLKALEEYSKNVENKKNKINISA